MSNTLRVAVIGTGGVAQTHLRNLSQHPDVAIAGTCDVVPDKAEDAATRYGAKAFVDFRAMLDELKPSAAFIKCGLGCGSIVVFGSDRGDGGTD